MSTQEADRARIKPIIRAMRAITTGRLASVCALTHERVVKAVVGWDAVEVKRHHGDTRIIWKAGQ